MTARLLMRRLDEVRRAGQSEEVGKIVIIYPDDWPKDVRDAYDAACAAGDEGLQADIIEAQTGERPVFWSEGMSVIRLHRPDIAVIEVRRTRAGDYMSHLRDRVVPFDPRPRSAGPWREIR